MPLDVWAVDPQACWVPRGKPEMSQTKNTQHIFYFNTCTTQLLLFCAIWPANARLFDKLSHSSYMFCHYCVILREFV